VHLSPSIDRGVQSFICGRLFLVMYFGMVAVEVSKATALIVSLVAAFPIFLLAAPRQR
jgi:hypothetical protein